MNERGSVEGVIAIVIVAGFIFGFVWLWVAKPEISSGGHAATGTEHAEKPKTKTRCGFGFAGPAIIEEELSNGYRYAGKVNTVLCGDDGLSFYLDEEIKR